ncbi:MAG: hypothetical protein AABW48_04230 [Nanoarchaeota archaeon]
MDIITILLFFVYTWGLGFTATYFFKLPESKLERNLVRIAIGFGIFPLLSIFLNLFRIPLDWRIFLALSLVFPIIILLKNIKKIKILIKNIKISFFKITKSDIVLIIVLLLTLASLYMYTKGAFSYPYLEDEDPWGHSVGVKYVAIEKDAYDPPFEGPGNTMDKKLSYMDPYPPAYDVLLGVLHQTSPDLRWVIKFFNALIVSLGILFFYLFAKLFIGDRNKALFATFVLAAIPCYLSHFIWAHALVITLFFPAMYAFLMVKEDKKWAIVAALIVGSVWVAQNLEQPVKLTTMLLIYIVVNSIVYWKFLKYESLALVTGIFLSFSWWGAMVVKYGIKGVLNYYSGDAIINTTGSVITTTANTANGSIGYVGLIFSKISIILGFLTRPGGSGARAYSFNDFFIAQGQNMINNPIGVGVVLSLLTLIGLICLLIKYKSKIVAKENAWLCLSLFWLIFTFWGVNGATFPISVARGPFRTWMLLAIAVALVATEGFYFVKNFFGKNKILQFVVVGVIILGIIFTSAQQKYELNTANWPTSGSFMTAQEPLEYGALFDTLPVNTKVFLYSPRDKLVIGFGKFSCDWCQEVISFRGDILNKNAQELYSFLKINNYEYFIINGPMDYKYFKGPFTEEKTKELLPKRYEEIMGSGLFTPIQQVGDRIILFKVK